MKNRLALLLLLALPSAGAAQSESFIVRLGRDTIAIETFVRTATRLEGQLSGAAVRARIGYVVELKDGAPVTMQMEVIPAGSDTATMKGAMQFVRDSVIVQLNRAGAAQPEQRLATQPGAVPFINLSFALVELITTRATRTPGDSLAAPLFSIGNGVTFPARLQWLGADSAVMDLGGVELRMHLDARGRIMHADVPSQNVTIERVAGTLNRAPEPAADYSAPAGAGYTAQDVTIKTPAGHTLASTLTMPRTRAGRLPVVITISGSGPQDRDETLTGLNGYRPFRELAESLAGRGVAVLRYDDRGFGGSTGVHATATSADFAEDTRAVVEWVRHRSEIDPGKVFLLGHSEGGMIAPMVAADDTLLRGIVLLAGPAYTGRRILEYQTRYGLSLQTGKTAAERDSLLHVNMERIDSLGVDQPWVRYFRDYDPLPTVRRVRVPVLIVQGATDRQVTADQADVLARELRAAGNSAVAMHVLPEVNHLFLHDPVGSASGYAALASRKVVPQLLQIVSDWIVKNSK